MGTGLNAVTLAMPSAATLGSVAVLRNSAYQETATATDDVVFGQTPANLLVGGYRSVDLALIVVEPFYDIAQGAAPYTLSIESRDAVHLNTPTTTPVTELANNPSALAADLANYNQFYFDVSQPDQTIALSLTWTAGVRGLLFDQNGDSAAEFVDAIDDADTWSTYSGLVRVHLAGRYYFDVYDPAGTPGTTTLGVTSTITELPRSTITTGEATGAIALGPTAETTLIYPPGTTPWQTFDASGTNTGGLAARAVQARRSRYGRLDALTLVGGAIVDPGLDELLVASYPSGGDPVGRVLLDDHVAQYLVRVAALAPTTSPTVSLTFAPRTFTDLGALSARSAPRRQITRSTRAIAPATSCFVVRPRARRRSRCIRRSPARSIRSSSCSTPMNPRPARS